MRCIVHILTEPGPNAPPAEGCYYLKAVFVPVYKRSRNCGRRAYYLKGRRVYLSSRSFPELFWYAPDGEEVEVLVAPYRIVYASVDGRHFRLGRKRFFEGYTSRVSGRWQFRW